MASSTRSLTNLMRSLLNRQQTLSQMAVRSHHVTRTVNAPHGTVRAQTFTTTTLTRMASTSSVSENPHPQKSAQEDREKMSVEPNEYSKSMTDTDAAQQDEAAYDPHITNPQSAKEKAGEGKEVNPLDASPANPEISQQTGEAASGPGKKVGGGSNKSSGGSTAGQGNQ